MSVPKNFFEQKEIVVTSSKTRTFVSYFRSWSHQDILPPPLVPIPRKYYIRIESEERDYKGESVCLGVFQMRLNKRVIKANKQYFKN